VSAGNEPALDPAVLARVGDLELVARRLVEGLVSGLHRSPFHGYSAEFSQYRHYRPGDDLKYVDWKLLARTDRLYTKQFRETTNTLATIVIAAALAHLISRQGDAVGLVTMRGGETVYLPSRGGRQHLRALVAALSNLGNPGHRGAWRGAAAIRTAGDRMSGRGLLLVLSDFYDDEDFTWSALKRVSRMGHEVVLFHVVSREELEFPYRRDFEFADLETGETRSVDAALARKAYRDGIAAFLERWRVGAAAEGFDYSLLITDTPPDRALRTFLLRRSLA